MLTEKLYKIREQYSELLYLLAEVARKHSPDKFIGLSAYADSWDAGIGDDYVTVTFEVFGSMGYHDFMTIKIPNVVINEE